MRGRQARRARVRHAAEASMAPPAASPTCRRWRADGLLWTDPRTAPILRWLLCRGGGERPAEASVVGSARGGDERRKPVSPSGANYTGQLRGGQATIRPRDPTSRHRRRPPTATNLDAIASRNLANANFPDAPRIVVVTATPGRTRRCTIGDLINSRDRAIATFPSPPAAPPAAPLWPPASSSTGSIKKIFGSKRISDRRFVRRSAPPTCGKLEGRGCAANYA